MHPFARAAGRAALSFLGNLLLIVALLFLCLIFAAVTTGCGSARADPDPTPEKPKVGCLLATPDQQARVGGRILPETVLIIGTTSFEDGGRWKVVRAPDWNQEEWLPYANDAVHFGARCRIGNVSSLVDASRAGPTGN